MADGDRIFTWARNSHGFQGGFSYGSIVEGINHLDNYSPECLREFSREILQMIKDCDASWEEMVPTSVANVIKDRKYFNYQCPEVCPTRQGFAGNNFVSTNSRLVVCRTNPEQVDSAQNSHDAIA
ncbi:MAG: hypothetical protein ACI9HK_001942 [Pirellulaceae bacterium]|jgi:hypothetical protein